MRIIFAATLALASAAATAQTPTPGQGFQTLYTTGISTGIAGVISQEDTLCPAGAPYNLPAGTLANVGDRIRIVAAGTTASSTDTKNVRLRFGTGAPGVISQPLLSTASGTRWSLTAEIVKTGPSAQSYSVIGVAQNSALTGGIAAGTLTFTDTAPIPISVTGQNTTSAVAASLTCQYLSVDLLRAATQ
jgi:hypothetical protein